MALPITITSRGLPVVISTNGIGLPVVIVENTLPPSPNIAPSVLTQPTISGATAGTILGSSNGTASGTPEPTPAIQWKRNGTVLSGQTGATLDTTGFPAGDVIERLTIWTNSEGSATGGPVSVTLTAQQVLSVTGVSPNPIVANEAFTLTFNASPDAVSSSVPLTGTGATRTGTAPASGSVAVDASKADYLPFSASYVVDTAVITPNAAITTAQMYDGQTVGNIPNFASINNTSYFSRAGRTISSVQAKKGQMVSPGVGQPAVLSNLTNVTGATVLNTGDVVVIDVTDSGGTMRRFTLAETQYMVNVTQVGGEILIDINDLVPSGEVFPYTDSFGTINLTRAMLADGEENYVLPTLTGTAAVGATLTGTPGKWLYNPDMPVPTKTHTITQDGTTVHTFASGAALTYVIPTGGDGKAYRLVESVGGSTAQSAAINVPSAGPVVDTFTAADGTLIKNYVGESGLSWTVGTDTDQTYAKIRGGRVIADHNSNGYRYISRMDAVGADHAVEADYHMNTSTSAGTWLAVRVDSSNPNRTTGYSMVVISGGQFLLRHVNGDLGVLATNFMPEAIPAAGSSVRLRLEVQGSTLRVYAGNVLKLTHTDTSPIATGRPGLCVKGLYEYMDMITIDNFTAWGL